MRLKLGIAAGILILLAPFAAHAAGSSTPTTSPVLSALAGSSTPVESSEWIEQHVTNLSPRAAKVATPILVATDNARLWLTAFLQNQIVATLPHLPGNNLLNPVSKNLTATSHFDWNRVLETLIGVAWTVYFYVLIIIRFVVAKIALFYPIATFAILYGLWQLVRYIRG